MIPFKKTQKILIILLIIFGVFFQSITMVRSGLNYSFGIGFWGPNGHDGIWHLALASQAFKSFPPPQPIFSGLTMSNYHFLYDYFIAIVNLVTKIPLNIIYFQIFPVLTSLAIGVLSFIAGYLWKKKYWVGFWLAFLNFFAGSLGYLITLFRDKTLGGESIFWSMQSTSTLINPPFALSLVFILIGIILLLSTKKLNYIKILATGLIFGILIGIKSYAGVIALSGLFVYSVFNFKNEKKYFFVFLLSVLISAGLFIITSKNAGSLFVFQPFWFVNSMIEAPDRLYLFSLAVKINNLRASIGPKLIFYESLGLVIFLIGNLGIRILGTKSLLNIRVIRPFEMFLYSILLIGFLTPLFFVQKGTPWNTIQFFYYFLFAFNFFAADSITELISKKKIVSYLIILLVVGSCFLSSYGSLKGYFGWPPPAKISDLQIEALNFLKKQPDGIVLTFPFNEDVKDKNNQTPIQINRYETTAFVTAYTNKITYLADEMNLQIMQVDFEKRKKGTQSFFFDENSDNNIKIDFLKENNIRYIYLTDNEKLIFAPQEDSLNKIFSNQTEVIYQII